MRCICFYVIVPVFSAVGEKAAYPARALCIVGLYRLLYCCCCCSSSRAAIRAAGLGTMGVLTIEAKMTALLYNVHYESKLMSNRTWILLLWIRYWQEHLLTIHEVYEVLLDVQIPIHMWVGTIQHASKSVPDTVFFEICSFDMQFGSTSRLNTPERGSLVHHTSPTDCYLFV